MNNTETTAPKNSIYSKLHKETETSIDFEGYSKKQIEKFDKETNQLDITPISKKIEFSEESKIVAILDSKANSIDDIYFETGFTSFELQTSLRLLAEAIKYSQSAISELRQNNLIESDDAIHHIQSLLPELFCCRTLSESFGALINSVQNALLNNKGMPLSEKKLLGLNEILTIARNEPFMKYDKAIDVIMAFEDLDFVVEPIGFDILSEMFDE